MVRVSFTHLSDARGSLSGATYSKNGGTNYIRRRVKGTNVRSNSQISQRYIQAMLSRSWGELTQAERDAWDLATKTYTYSNKLGQRGTISGFQYYLKLNMPLAKLGQTLLVDPPINHDVIGIETIVSVTATAASQTVAIAFAPAPTDANSYVEVWATSPQPMGRGNLNNKYTVIGSFPSATASPLAAGSMFVAKYGNFQAGQKIGIRLVTVNVLNGIRSVAASFTAITV